MNLFLGVSITIQRSSSFVDKINLTKLITRADQVIDRVSYGSSLSPSVFAGGCARSQMLRAAC